MSDKIPILIIGLGNEYRKDDGLALSIVSRFKKSHPKKIRVIDSISDGTALMEEWSKGKIVFVIDAVDSGGKPGSIYRFDVKTDI
ncbi:MAG: hydrogenase maturation protease, partial [candidate division Zixibacteria bacterium]|nr:hydrogenase maturation protease [candidate division Zixibacteria bacterium]